MVKMVKIAFFEADKWEKALLKKKLPNCDLQLFDATLSNENIDRVKDVEIIAVFVNSRVTREFLDKLPCLKFIATMSTGFDHIDVETCKKRGIIISNVPFYGMNTVAEYTFALLLALCRKVLIAVDRVKEGEFELSGLQGFDLKGKTLGVIGTGNIGLNVIKIASGFEMKVVAFDVKKNFKAAKKLGFKYVSFGALLKNSDVISIHVPYNKDTHHLIDKNSFRKMKKGVFLVNTARGGVIETAALLEAIKQKKVGGAALDVLEEETAMKHNVELLPRDFNVDFETIALNYELIDQDNVIVAPHSAFYSKEALDRILETTVENIVKFLKKKPVNVIVV